ncbi:MAG: hypothetical protein ABSE53_08055 [Terracidiphilus sp.]|jgi:hypothetical protein
MTHPILNRILTLDQIADERFLEHRRLELIWDWPPMRATSIIPAGR